MQVRFLALAIALLISVGCSKQKYGQCEASDGHLKVMFKAKNPAHPFSHSFCIVCNTELEPSEYGAWAMEMGAPAGPSDVDGKHPCLYVYSDTELEDGIDSLELCQSLVCGGGASYNDMVGKNNGNFNLGPILNDSSLEASDGWSEAGEASPPMSLPQDATRLSNPDPRRTR